MISVKNLSYNYDYSKTETLINLNINFDDKGFYLLSGNSGCGKTTFLNLLSADLQIQKGDIVFDDYSYSSHSQSENQSFVKDNIAYIDQDFHIMQGICLYDYIKIVKPTITKKDIKKYMEFFKLDKIHSNTKVKKLSTGEKQRLAILVALLLEKKIILCDEITANLDEKNKYIILEILKQLSSDHLIICVSHELELYFEFVDYHFAFYEGRFELSPFDDSNKVDVSNKIISLENKKRPASLFFILYKNYFSRYFIITIMMIFYLLISLVSLNRAFFYDYEEIYYNKNIGYLNNVIVCTTDYKDTDFTSCSFSTNGIDSNSLKVSSGLFTFKSNNKNFYGRETYDFIHETLIKGEYEDNENYVYIGVNPKYDNYNLLSEAYHSTIIYEGKELFVNGIYKNELMLGGAVVSFNSNINFSSERLKKASFKFGGETKTFASCFDRQFNEIFIPVNSIEDTKEFYIMAYNSFVKVDMSKYYDEVEYLEMSGEDLITYDNYPCILLNDDELADVLNNLPLTAFYYNDFNELQSDLESCSVNSYCFYYYFSYYSAKEFFSFSRSAYTSRYLFIGIYLALDAIFILILLLIKKHSRIYNSDILVLEKISNKKNVSRKLNYILLTNILVAFVVMIPALFILDKYVFLASVVNTTIMTIFNFIVMMAFIYIGDKDVVR